MKSVASEQIKGLFRDGKADEVSKSLILESLREHNIQDLDAYVEQGLQANKDAQSKPVTSLLPELGKRTSEEARIELLFGKKAEADAKGATHKEPKLPFIVGETCFRPAEITRFHGKLLHYLWDLNVVENGFLRAVTDPDEYRAFLNGGQPSAAAAPRVRSHVPGAGHTFWQHINFGGYSLGLGYRHALPDLTRVTMSGWWFWTTSWNDQISSLMTGSGPVTLGEHVMRPYLTGATMTIPGNTRIPWIGGAWNDRVSAILG